MVRLMVQLGSYTTEHELLVAEHLLMPVILGVDFLSKHAVTVVFYQSLVYIRNGKEVIHTVGRQDKASMCYAVSTRSDPEENDGVDECAVPRFSEAPSYDIPSCPAELQAVVDEYKQFFQQFLVQQILLTIPFLQLAILQSVFLHVAYQPS